MPLFPTPATSLPSVLHIIDHIPFGSFALSSITGDAEAEEMSYMANGRVALDARIREGVVGWRKILVIAEELGGMVWINEGGSGEAENLGSAYTEIFDLGQSS